MPEGGNIEIEGGNGVMVMNDYISAELVNRYQNTID